MSSYPFESFLGHLKYYLRSAHKPLAQIAKRICEWSKPEKSRTTPQMFPWVEMNNLAVPSVMESNMSQKYIIYR